MPKNTSVTLGSHFETFVDSRVQTGRYASATQSSSKSLKATFQHTCLIGYRVSRRARQAAEAESEIWEAIAFHLDGMREDGISPSVPESQVAYVGVAA